MLFLKPLNPSIGRTCLRLIWFFCVLASTTWTVALAQPFASVLSLQIGEKTIHLPTPQGFIETSKKSQEFWNTVQMYGAGDACIVAHFVTEQNLRSFESGKTVIFKQYMLVQTPRRAESITATQAQFDKLRKGTVDLQNNLTSHLEPRLAAEAEQVSKAASAGQGTPIHIHLGEVVPVSIDRNDSQTLIYTILAQASVSDNKANSSQNMVSTSAYCFVAGKVVMLVAYRYFNSPQDLQATRNFVNAWAIALLAAN